MLKFYQKTPINYVTKCQFSHSLLAGFIFAYYTTLKLFIKL